MAFCKENYSTNRNLMILLHDWALGHEILRIKVFLHPKYEYNKSKRYTWKKRTLHVPPPPPPHPPHLILCKGVEYCGNMDFEMMAFSFSHICTFDQVICKLWYGQRVRATAQSNLCVEMETLENISFFPCLFMGKFKYVKNIMVLPVEWNWRKGTRKKKLRYWRNRFD